MRAETEGEALREASQQTVHEELIKQLPYRDVTAEEAKRLTGFNLEGWVVGMHPGDWVTARMHPNAGRLLVSPTTYSRIAC